MRDKMECQKCGCISLAYQTTTDKTPHIETWSCGACGHTECFHVAKPSYPERNYGWEQFVIMVGGFGAIDEMGKIEGMKRAFEAGRSYEAARTIEQLKPLQEGIAEISKTTMGKRQA